jgi:hypothetical protein
VGASQGDQSEHGHWRAEHGPKMSLNLFSLQIRHGSLAN